MAFVSGSKNNFSIKAYQGDFKSLLAFNFQSKADAAHLAGFSIQCQPPGKQPYYLSNDLAFPKPNQHATMPGEPTDSSANNPFQKYRWVNVPGSVHQGLTPAVGNYIYTVTPRFFGADGNLLALDPSLSAAITVPVVPFQKGALSLGFTRGYMQSQAFANHFGSKTSIEPKGRALVFDTSAIAGQNKVGQNVTYDQIYDWMGWTGRVQIFDLLNDVLNDNSLSLDVFAYDLDEPNLVSILLKLAPTGRIRIILDNSTSHIQHTDSKTKKIVTPLEVPFAQQFGQAAKNAANQLLLGHFNRYAHDKIFIVSKNGNPTKVLTGSTNFSVTGLYVNANHVLVFDDASIATEYQKVFNESWNDHCSASKFAQSSFATAPYKPSLPGINLTINFSPHTAADVNTVLGALVNRINAEAGKAKGSVIFAVMQIDDTPKGNNKPPNDPVYTALNNINKQGAIFSYGISDAPDSVVLYQPSKPQGVLVTGKPTNVQLPPPFNQVPTLPGHEIHDKFVICGLNGPDPVVYCGSSNLANGGEQANGDNLLEIHDADVATAFAIEALGLIDHYNFLDRYAQAKKKATAATKKTAAKKAATSATKKSAAKSTAKTANKPATKAAKKPPRKVATEDAAKKTIPRKRAAKKSANKSGKSRATTKTSSRKR